MDLRSDLSGSNFSAAREVIYSLRTAIGCNEMYVQGPMAARIRTLGNVLRLVRKDVVAND